MASSVRRLSTNSTCVAKPTSALVSDILQSVRQLFVAQRRLCAFRGFPCNSAVIVQNQHTLLQIGDGTMHSSVTEPDKPLSNVL